MMRTRAILVTVVMAAGLAGAQSRSFCAAAIGRSANAFCQYFQALRQESLNPVERVVFSLALAKAKTRRECKPAVHL
ncbi:MAG TPA: hypothetical protein VMG35_13355 [Bryobacteraceae bacterium]|nr:hypothetical protein [Bryobacteraceae bacterium]